MWEACGITTVTVMGATTGVIPPEMLPWDGKKMAAQNTQLTCSEPADVQRQLAEA